ncbi:hypothetical protein, partial [Aggregatibacter actinomycetemcomitans]|uniref:hypothetical protein n=1 Tax=Aggregatibacter actinomycetemcomitans TaxID=714 RepID=UPI00197C64AD
GNRYFIYNERLMTKLTSDNFSQKLSIGEPRTVTVTSPAGQFTAQQNANAHPIEDLQRQRL